MKRPRLTKGRVNGLIAAGLALVSFVAVFASQRSQGIARDEAQYLGFGASYARFWGELWDGLHLRGLHLSIDARVVSRANITAHFGGAGLTDNNREHPPLMKTLFGFSGQILGGHGMSFLSANRVPTIALNALLIALVFLFTAGIWGRAEGIVAALCMLCMPRAFFHAGLACFDAPIAALWFVTSYVYLRALRPGKTFTGIGAAIGTGLCFGLALATKHNAIILPVPLLVHYLWVAGWSQRARIPGRGALGVAAALGQGIVRRRPLIIISLVLLGPLVLIALWPWLWFDTVAHIQAWLGFHFHHTHYNYEYLGRNWNHPRFPWHIALVTTLFTVPVATTVCALIGAAVLARRALGRRAADPDRAPALLCVLSAGAAMGPFLLGSTPVFGAEKHWEPAMPFLCVFAGVGLCAAVRAALPRIAALWPRARRLAEARAQTLVMAAAGALVVAAAAVETAHAQPYALSSYNALAGGAPGGADLGMNRQFWGVSARGVLDWLDANAPPNTRIYAHDADIAWPYYHQLGLLRRDINDSGHEEAGVASSTMAIVIHELHFNRHDYMIWRNYGTVRPAYVLTFDGVPLVSVYQRPR